MKPLGEQVISNPNTFTFLIVTLVAVALFAFIMLNTQYIPLFNNKCVGKFVHGGVIFSSVLFIAILGSCIHTCLSNNATEDKFTKLQEASIILQQKIENLATKEVIK